VFIDYIAINVVRKTTRRNSKSVIKEQRTIGKEKPVCSVRKSLCLSRKRV
tara:strand:- start:1006 stop:1155 length:150 start_codon:yes stop_codon:yes gene_type:complete